MWIFAILCAVLVALLIIQSINAKKAVGESSEEKQGKVEIEHYYRKNLLTKNEWAFYKSLKPIADKLNLSVITKVRMADLIAIRSGISKSEWQTAFNRISKKHIDFVLCNPENLYPMLLIELDDNSHDTEKQKQRDEFVESIYKKTGYKLLRVKGTAGLEEKITEVLKES